MSHHEREVIGVDDRVSPARAIPLGIQHMMSMFGSTVLVPVLTGLDPNVAIMCSGIGTICYLLVTGNKIPSYLGSSFAFISPIIAVGATQGLDAAMSGVIVAGAVFLVVAGIIKFVGTGWLDRLLPCSSPRSWWSLAWGSRPPPQTWPSWAPTLREHRFSTRRALSWPPSPCSRP